MTSGLPDYTRKFVVDVVVSPSVNFLGSLAETKIKAHVTEKITDPGDMCSIVPSSGKRAGLLMALSSSQYLADTIKIQVYKDGAWADVIKPIHAAFFLAFPCWQPDMDEGDGSAARVKMVTTGTGPWSGFFLYYEY